MPNASKKRRPRSYPEGRLEADLLSIDLENAQTCLSCPIWEQAGLDCVFTYPDRKPPEEAALCPVWVAHSESLRKRRGGPKKPPRLIGPEHCESCRINPMSRGLCRNCYMMAYKRGELTKWARVNKENRVGNHEYRD